MAKYKVSQLEGAKLDEAVARAEGWLRDKRFGWVVPSFIQGLAGSDPIDATYIEPKPLPWSTNWQHGGRIIEREGIGLALIGGPLGWWAHHGMGSTGDLDGGSYGPTPLIAAMRCFVASKFGEEIDL